jgi:signal transduction histidine kinase/CheY-like chemotaxis protein
VWSHTAICDDAGEVEYIIGTGVDITARKQAEESVHQEELRLNSLLELSQKASELSEQEIIQLTLEEAVKLTQSQIGYLHFMNADQETLQFCTWSQATLASCTAVHQAHYPLSEAGVWADCVRQRQPVVHNDYQQLAQRQGYPEGHSHLVRHVSVPVLDGDNVTLILGVGNKPSDYHEADVRQMRLVAENLWRILRRKRLEEQLHEHVRALEAEDRHKNEFLAMLAHELRNPLAPICNAVQVLDSPQGSGAIAVQARQVLRRQLDHLVRLVDDLLDISRINQGKIELQCQPLNLAEVIAHAVEISRPLIESAGHALTVTCPPQPVWVYGDAVRLSQVVANLLNNAAKYTLEGGQLRLSVHDEAGQAVLRVQDTGIGIPAEVLPRIFDLFVQADHSLDRAQGGLGLGLSLVRTLVELHGGTVEAFSAGAGQGSELTIRLPLLTMAAAPTSFPPEQAVPPAALRATRILIVDDNQDAAAMLGELLQGFGLEVMLAHDGPAALETVESTRPRIVLLDIGLPDMDGYEVARRLRQQAAGRDVLLIALTGYGDADSRQRSRAAGCDHHLVKPVNLDALLDLIVGVDSGD